MRKTILYLFTLVSLAACSANNNDPAPAPEKTTYSNPVIARSLPDPTIIKANDGYFYLYATEDVRNMPIYKSKDLIRHFIRGYFDGDGCVTLQKNKYSIRPYVSIIGT